MLDTQEKEKQMCDCRKQECPVNCNCLMQFLIFKVAVKTLIQNKFYIGTTRLMFKNCYRKQRYSFKHK